MGKVLFLVKRLLLLVPMLLLSNEINTSSEPQPEPAIEHKINENNQSAESFLLEYEYGRMLYNNPRGISCAKCHGEKGRGGQKIAKYYDNDKNPKILKGVDITGDSLEQLEASLENRLKNANHQQVTHKIMPRYYLTSEEIKAIYTYLQQQKETN